MPPGEPPHHQPPPGPYPPPPPGAYYPPPPGPYYPPPPGPYGPPARGTNWWAIVALVFGILCGVLFLAGIVFYLVVGRGTVGANEVKAGDCLKELPASGLVLTLDTVACSEPHTGEIFSVMTMPDGDFPGQFAIEEYQNKCAPELAEYSPEAASDQEIGVLALYPSRDSWGQGDRTVTCIATSDSPRTGTFNN